MAGSMVLKVVCVLVACMVVCAPYAEAITCGQVMVMMASCVNYLKTGVGAPSVSCCNGVSSLNGMAKTSPDRQAICVCLKQVASNIGIKPGVAATLPSKCGVDIPYKISPSIDCTKLM